MIILHFHLQPQFKYELPVFHILHINIIVVFIIIIIIIIIVWSSPVLWYLLGNLSHVSAKYQQLRDTTLSARYEQYQGWLTTLHFQKMSGRLNFPYQTMHSSRLIMMGITVTLVALWILLISRARSWYFFTFSSSASSKDIFVRWHNNVNKCPLLYVFLYTSSISLDDCASAACP